MVDDERELRELVDQRLGGACLGRADQQLADQPAVTDRRRRPSHGSPGQPPGSGWSWAIARQPGVAMGEQAVELAPGIGRGEVDPPDHPGDQGLGARDVEQLLGLGEIGRGLDHDRLHDAVGDDRRGEVGGPEAAPDRRVLGRAQEPVGAPARIPQMMVGVDDRGGRDGVMGRAPAARRPAAPRP